MLRPFIIILFSCLVLSISSCKNREIPTPRNEAELCNWIKENVAVGIKDSIDASSVDIYEWIYIATGKVDSLPKVYERAGLIDVNTQFSIEKYSQYIAEPSEFEPICYKTMDETMYILGGFYHTPDTVYEPKEIRMDGSHHQRQPFSLTIKNGYANYWQLHGEWPVGFRTYFSLWYFLAGYIPTEDSYIAACRYKTSGSPIINEGSSIFFLNKEGKIVALVPLMDYDIIMQYINQSYWNAFASTHSAEEIQRHLDYVVPLGSGECVDRNGTEYYNGLIITYGTDFGSWKTR